MLLELRNFLTRSKHTMNTLNDLIGTLNKEETRHLKLLLNRTNTNSEHRKDVRLFDYVRKTGEKYKEDKILRELYGESGKNAFYRLKNRLKEDIGRSLTLQYYSSTDSNAVLFNIALARHFHERREFDLASHYLNTAEKKAERNHSYELLDIIYGDLIKLTHESLAVNPEAYIKKRIENRKQLRQLQDIDDILAALIYRIRVSQNFGKTNDQIVELLKQTIDEHTSDKALAKSPVLRFQIYHAVSRMLLQQHDYEALEDYLKRTLEEFEAEGLFNRSNHDTKLQMLTYLANSLYKNNKLDESLDYGAMLYEAMLEHGKLLYDKYLFYYYNIMVNNYGYIDKDKAIEILIEARDNTLIDQNPVNKVFILLQLALQYFDLGQYKNAGKSISGLKISDGYTSLDEGLKLKIEIAELIVRYEQGDHDLLEYLIGRVSKDFSKLFQDESYSRQKRMLEILTELIYDPKPDADSELAGKITAIIEEVPLEEAYDTDVLNYNEWLSSKTQT